MVTLAKTAQSFRQKIALRDLDPALTAHTSKPGLNRSSLRRLFAKDFNKLDPRWTGARASHYASRDS